MRTLSPETQTLYAELMDQLTAMEARRSIGHLKGCFITKTIKGDVYYYFQHVGIEGAQRQIYLGRQTPALDRLAGQFKKEKELQKPDMDHVRSLCAQIRAGKAMTTDAATAKVIKALSDSGVFRLSGVLVGTHAFMVMGNVLGVNWETHVKTHDIDIASHKAVDVALPDTTVDVPGTLEKLQMGFLPVPALNHKHSSTSFKVRGQTLRVDFLTPAHGRTDETPVFIPKLNIAAQPLPFLGYLLEDFEKGAVVNSEGILVNIPAPARYAFHKIIISQERSFSMHTKALKDMAQAASLLGILCEERAGDVIAAWRALQKQSKTWLSRAQRGLKLLASKHPAEHKKVSSVIKRLGNYSGNRG